MTKNQLEYRAQNEQIRANKAKEAETKRYNLVREDIDRASLAQDLLKHQQVLYETNRSNVAKEAEATRSNLAREAENRRANIASLDELSRHNRATEALGRENVSYSYAQLKEQTRHNKAQEALGGQNIVLGFSSLAETTRSNQARETETSRSNVARETESHRSNVVNETISGIRNRETIRSNKANESIRLDELAQRTWKDQADIALGHRKAQETERNNLINNVISGFDTVAKHATTIIDLLY